MRSDSTFSVVIPTYQRPQQLQRCLEAVSRLHYPREMFEVIIVDDGSKVPPAEIVDAFTSEGNLRLVIQSHAGPACGRNRGAREAKNEYVVFTDDDCLPMPDWLETLAKRFQDLPDHGIGGRTLNGIPSNLFSTASQLLTDYVYSYYNRLDAGGSVFFASNNLAFPREAFLKAGGFDQSFPRAGSEDRELCARWVQQGHLLTFAPEVCVEHQHPLSFRRYWRQHFNYGRGAYRYHLLRLQQNSEKIRVEPVPFYKNLLTFPFQKKSGASAAILSGLMGLSQVANAAGFFWERIVTEKN